MMDAPESRSDKMLVISGRDESDLVVAVKALASGDHVLIGDKLPIKDLRKPRSDRLMMRQLGAD